MKKTMMLLALAALTLAAQAQKFYARPYNHPRLIVTTGVYAPAYPYGLYGPFYPYGYAAPVRTSRLELGWKISGPITRTGSGPRVTTIACRGVKGKKRSGT